MVVLRDGKPHIKKMVAECVTCESILLLEEDNIVNGRPSCKCPCCWDDIEIAYPMYGKEANAIMSSLKKFPRKMYVNNDGEKIVGMKLVYGMIPGRKYVTASKDDGFLDVWDNVTEILSV